MHSAPVLPIHAFWKGKEHRSQTPGICVVDVLGAGERKSAEELGIDGGTELSDPVLER